jgi:hypothetical protein
MSTIFPFQKLIPLLTFFLCAFASSCHAAKILVLCPFPAPSHWMWIEHFVKELLNRGHEVMAITNFYAKEPHKNYTELVINPKFNIPHYCEYMLDLQEKALILIICSLPF